MAEPEALRPCPFCGNQPFLTGHERHPAWWHVKCLHCQKVISQTNRLRTKADAVAAWNNRTAISSALTAASPVQEGWMAIETAPRDWHTSILIWFPFGPGLGEKGCMFIARWSYAREGDDYAAKPSWIDPDDGEDLGDAPGFPSHWMPLPAAPETTGVLPTGEMG